ncbi:histidinol phosphate phosphatase H [Hesseltinella vesiculosa]|uniref:Histidinol-phosphatase n=1 Tax=Hesseltinella vesiculosa TaxID=101127 RepID=A0A1X2GRW8_9FUNG|nr:histidinol phosphate phosphatase H [Hesseltinella vesiculosa]
MPYSYHSHSGQFCHHGYGDLEAVVQNAIAKQFKVYGLSEHMPRFDMNELYPEELEANCTPETLATLFNDFVNEARRLQSKYKDQIVLLVGSELEFIQPSYATMITRLRQRYALDYVVGSLHHVGGIPIDFSNELYQKCLNRFGSYTKLFEAYFDEQWQMLQTVKPEVVGHLDLVRIFAEPEAAASAMADPLVWSRIERNVDYVIGYGGIFEINSRAWKKGLRDAYPNQAIVQLIQQKHGRLTLSDDCHGPQDVGMFYDKLLTYLQTTGVDTISYLTLDDQGKVVLRENKSILQDSFWTSLSNT